MLQVLIKILLMTLAVGNHHIKINFPIKVGALTLVSVKLGIKFATHLKSVLLVIS